VSSIYCRINTGGRACGLAIPPRRYGAWVACFRAGLLVRSATRGVSVRACLLLGGRCGGGLFGLLHVAKGGTGAGLLRGIPVGACNGPGLLAVLVAAGLALPVGEVIAPLAVRGFGLQLCGLAGRACRGRGLLLPVGEVIAPLAVRGFGLQLCGLAGRACHGRGLLCRSGR